MILGLIVVGAIFAPLIASWDPTTIDFDAPLAPPGTANHPLGTDNNGMDILSRLLYGARLDVGVAVVSVFAAVVIGGTIGAIVGYKGGWIDETTMRFMDIFQSFPGFVLALCVATMLGTSVLSLVEVIVLVSVPGYVRLMRTEVRSVREEGWVDAARCAGLSWPNILFRQVIPNSLRPILVIAPFNCGWAILILAGLSFVGLGVSVPDAEWGAMIANGADDMVSGQWWTSVLPGIFLFLAVLAFNLLSEGLRVSRR